MRYFRRYQFLILIALLLSIPSVAQRDCKSMLLAAMAKMKKIEGNHFAMEYQVRTQMANSENDMEFLEVSELHAAIYISGFKSKFVTDDMELLRDDLLQISVMKDEKKIYIMKSIAQDTKEIQKQVLTMLQDSILNWIKVVDCETICDAKDPSWYFERIDATMKTSRLTESTGIERVTYWVDRRNNSVARIKVNFSKHPMDVREIDFTVSRFEQNFKGDVFRGRAYDLVFSANNTLVSKYKGFEVVDYR